MFFFFVVIFIIYFLNFIVNYIRKIEKNYRLLILFVFDKKENNYMLNVLRFLGLWKGKLFKDYIEYCYSIYLCVIMMFFKFLVIVDYVEGVLCMSGL